MAQSDRVDPANPKRAGASDPFLEFEPEERRTASALERLGLPSRVPAARPAVQAQDWPAGAPRRSPVVSPALAFALGVAGLVTAAVAYYQMGQMLLRRSQAAASVQSAAVGGDPILSLEAAAAPADDRPAVGRLEITTSPPGAVVSVDGATRGATPLVLADVPVGSRQVVVSLNGVTAGRTVTIEAGAAAVLDIPLPAAPPRPAASAAGGWVQIDSPLDLRVLSGGRVLGTAGVGRFALAAGSHVLDLVDEALEVRQTVRASVVDGRVTRLTVPPPTGRLSANAMPWAEVWVAGVSIGMTPLANVSVPVGTHEVVFRHPVLGERRLMVPVKARTPARVWVDFER